MGCTSSTETRVAAPIAKRAMPPVATLQPSPAPATTLQPSPALSHNEWSCPTEPTSQGPDQGSEPVSTGGWPPVDTISQSCEPVSTGGWPPPYGSLEWIAAGL